jgi:hypothetical protein
LVNQRKIPDLGGEYGFGFGRKEIWEYLVGKGYRISDQGFEYMVYWG